MKSDYGAAEVVSTQHSALSTQHSALQLTNSKKRNASGVNQSWAKWDAKRKLCVKCKITTCNLLHIHPEQKKRQFSAVSLVNFVKNKTNVAFCCTYRRPGCLKMRGVLGILFRYYSLS